jgi:serine O-acetyltransferase
MVSLAPRPVLTQTPRLDPLWQRVREEAESALANDSVMGGVLLTSVLHHDTLEAALAHRLGARLGRAGLPSDLITQTCLEAFADKPALSLALRADINAVLERDPACTRALEPLLYFKGFHTLQIQRMTHWLWHNGRTDLALALQSLVSEVFQVDIHPQAKIGQGVFLDHATGVVIGSTAVVGDNVSILQGVTLGGTGKERGDRHPKIGFGVLIGAGAKVLGNIAVGCCSRIAAGSVVLQSVPANTTVAGVPAKVIGNAGCSDPANSMDHILRASDVSLHAGEAI